MRPKSEFNHPVIFVSWADANHFAEWMKCRLPTEAEWEYACRARTTTPFNTGYCPTTNQANYYGKYNGLNTTPKGQYRMNTTPVGSFQPNPWGLYDMHGNVAEWCSDWYGKYSNKQQTNPLGPNDGIYRITRGGSWYCDALDCRSGNRFPVGNCDRFNFIGFRLVLI